MITRRELLAASAVSALGQEQLDRRGLVRAHNPIFKEVNPRAPLSVGNGEFCFTVDPTGLQSFYTDYEKTVPLTTQSQWGWHSFPRPANTGDFLFEPFDTDGRAVGYATRKAGQEILYDWLRENPHRLNLARIGFAIARHECHAFEQTLDLWNGFITSRFQWKGKPVVVRTCCSPATDQIGVEITGEPPPIEIAFPYGSPAITASDWLHPDRHKTEFTRIGTRVRFARTLDDTQYHAALDWRGTATFREIEPHRFELRARGPLAFTVAFARRPPTNSQPPAAVFNASESHWNRFWSTGGAIAISASDPRAKELERRVVLSQYLTAIQCSGSLPPQETGLTANSWYGKFHLEMHWWHAAHFALWDRLPLLERSLPYYQSILPQARAIAKRQGYAGARWPKMTGPDGLDSPSPIGPLLIWQQPHPIAFAELCYQVRRDRETLERYREVVMETAAFMASYPVRKNGRYHLGPPVIPAQENHPPRETWNPTFELTYWRQGLGIAQEWRHRLGLPPERQWEDVRANLASPAVREGVYLAHENCPQTFTERNRDHPSMLAAFGVLPGESIDPEIMRRTLDRVLKQWRWPDTWGWDFPMAAMTAARLGERELAIDILLMDSPKNEYLPNGHNYQRPGLGLYLPGNGGLLAAVALMAAGWRDNPSQNPGFPAGWQVRSEGLRALL